MVRSYLWVLVVISIATSFAVSANDISAVIEKRSANDWVVTYQLESPVSRLAFKRNTDNARAARWKPLQESFVITYADGKEYIERSDKQPFKETSFQLTPTYISLVKEYAPFSPFSDGGMLFHSGHFFTCIEECHADSNSWAISVSAPQGDNIVLSGDIYNSTASWVDENSGTKVYVGKGTPVEEHHFISVIDKELPLKLRASLDEQLPGLMEFFASKFGQLGSRPALFASYSEGSNGKYGHQGGTLPGQVFMHWYGKQAMEQINADVTYWFFAHEVAHIYQQEGSNIGNSQDAWVHEGAAEYFAGVVADKSFFQTKLANARSSCIADLEVSSSYAEAAATNFNIHYTCGLVVMNAMSEDLANHDNGEDLFSLWSLFNKQVTAGKPASAKTFIETARPFLSNEMRELVESLLSTSESNTVELIKSFGEERVSA